MKRPFAISLLAGGMLYSTFAAAQMETGNAPKDRSLDEVVVTRATRPMPHNSLQRFPS